MATKRKKPTPKIQIHLFEHDWKENLSGGQLQRITELVKKEKSYVFGQLPVHTSDSVLHAVAPKEFFSWVTGTPLLDCAYEIMDNMIVEDQVSGQEVYDGGVMYWDNGRLWVDVIKNGDESDTEYMPYEDYLSLVMDYYNVSPSEKKTIESLGPESRIADLEKKLEIAEQTNKEFIDQIYELKEINRQLEDKIFELKEQANLS